MRDPFWDCSWHNDDPSHREVVKGEAETQEMADGANTDSAVLVDDDESTCIACQDQPRCVRFHECGHSLMCELCTLKLIAHSTGKVLKCPTCAGAVARIESDHQPLPKGEAEPTGDADETPRPAAPSPETSTGAAASIPIAKQPTFLTAAEGKVPGVEVEAFFKARLSSTDAECKKAAEAAQEAWTDLPSLMPGSGLMLPVQNTRAVSGRTPEPEPDAACRARLR